MRCLGKLDPCKCFAMLCHAMSAGLTEVDVTAELKAHRRLYRNSHRTRAPRIREDDKFQVALSCRLNHCDTYRNSGVSLFSWQFPHNFIAGTKYTHDKLGRARTGKNVTTDCCNLSLHLFSERKRTSRGLSFLTVQTWPKEVGAIDNQEEYKCCRPACCGYHQFAIAPAGNV